jgi:hypothetical protein
MIWFKHEIGKGGSSQFLTKLNLEFGPAGSYIFWRTLEIMAHEFTVDHPAENVFQWKWFLNQFVGVKRHQVVNILSVCHQQAVDTVGEKGIYFVREKKEVYVSSPRLKRNLDEYTQRLMKKTSKLYPDKLQTKSGETPTHRFRLRLRHSMKEANASPEKEKTPKKEPTNGGEKQNKEDFYSKEILGMVDRLYANYWKVVDGDRANNVHAWVASQNKKSIQPGATWAYLKHLLDLRPADRPVNPWTYANGFMKAYTQHDTTKRDDMFGNIVERLKALEPEFKGEK